MNEHGTEESRAITAEIGAFLRDLERLHAGDPSVDHDELMARKRALIERIEPGFYDRDMAYEPQPGSL